jgi:hypothetical protein
MFGNLHYHEPAGTETEWLPTDPETGMLADMSLAQVKAPDVTADFLTKLAAQTQVKLSPAGMQAVGLGDVLAPKELLPLEEGIAPVGGETIMAQQDLSTKVTEAGGDIMQLLAGAGITVPGWLTGLIGIAGAGYGLYQLLGGGEGEGLFGLDILGGGNGNGGAQTPVPIGGPGLAEPGKPYLLKEWHINYPKGRAQYYLVQRPTLRGKPTKYVMMYKTWDGTWTWWRLPKPNLAVIGKNMPSHRMITRLRRNMSRHTADAKTILKVASPNTYMKMQGWRKPSRRRR